MKIGFIGLGKLGLDCAEVFAEKFEVYGYDTSNIKSNKINICKTQIELVNNSDIIFIAVPTPHSKKYDGSIPSTNLKKRDFDYKYILNVLKKFKANKINNKIVVLISTVLPGTIREIFAKYITNTEFIYNPYLIAMGTVKWDFKNPELLIIGNKNGKQTKNTKKLIKIYKTLTVNNLRIAFGTWEETECIKIFYNTFISAKLSLVNMIQDVAVNLGNTNVDVITDALKSSDQRIMGPRYMTAGMGDGGGCHPRDNIALRFMSDKLNLGYDLFESIMHAREIQAKNLARKLLSHKLPIVIIGKSYKPGVKYTDGSYSLLIAHYLNKAKAIYYFHDLLTGDKVPKNIGKAVYLIAHNFEVTYLNTKSPKKINLMYNINPSKGSIFYDPYRKTSKIKNSQVISYGNTRLK